MNKKILTSKDNSESLQGHAYHYKRLRHPVVKFSLHCRIRAISNGILKLSPSGVGKLLDLGSADGLLVKGIFTQIPKIKHIYCLDIDDRLLKYNPFRSVKGDCCSMPFDQGTFDVITAAALIEHLPDPLSFFQECNRVLKPGGLLMLTCPAPFFDWLATKIGYLKTAGHLARYSLTDLRKLCERTGFKVCLSNKFMISPIYFPGHIYIEFLLRKLRFSFLMLNQFIAGVKVGDTAQGR